MYIFTKKPEKVLCFLAMAETGAFSKPKSKIS